jgi:hypothetical protein
MGDTVPPNLDVYVISPARDRETIERFLSMYVDRAAGENRGDEELMIAAIDAFGQPLEGDSWDWEPSKSLTHIIERGLEHPHRAFAVYLKTLEPSLAGAILSFTTDNQVIFGISLDDEGGKPENLEKAKILLHELARTLEGYKGFIAVEEPPPMRGIPGTPRFLAYSWTAG